MVAHLILWILGTIAFAVGAFERKNTPLNALNFISLGFMFWAAVNAATIVQQL